jgi:hypothetical protein
VSYSVGSGNAWWVATGDFNGDGKVDLAVTNFSSDNCQSGCSVSILLGNGDGTFQSHVDYPTGDLSPFGIAVGDFNGDGRLDLALTGGNGVSLCSSQKGCLGIMLGNGDGSFQAPTGVQVPVSRAVPSVGDFNRDGKLDLAYAFSDNFGNSSACILLGKGDGTFQSPACYAAGNVAFGGTSTVTADFNGDRKLDLGVGSSNNPVVAILLGNGDGTFAPFTLTPSSQPHTVTGYVIACDFNCDGKVDLAALGAGGNSSSVFLGNGDGTFQTPVILSPANTFVLLAAGDFNQDGRMEILESGEGTLGLAIQTAAVTLSASSLTFGNQKVGTTSPPQTVTLTNTGSGILQITSIAVTGTNSGDFAENNNCGKSLTGGASCTLSVTFKPTATGSRSAAVTITDNASGSPQQVTLSGTGQ